jgi:CRP/FNR family transcriptional regulator, cyclic AMP receptor protein
MKERFEGNGRPQLITALRRQGFAGGDVSVAEALCDAGALVEVKPGEDLIVQGRTDNEIYLQHVGEMAAIEPSLPRSATVRVLENVVALKITSADFMKLGERFPQMWLLIAQELGGRRTLVHRLARFCNLINMCFGDRIAG